MTDLQKDEVLNSVTTLLALVLATNGYEIRKRPYTGTLPTVFLIIRVTLTRCIFASIKTDGKAAKIMIARGRLTLTSQSPEKRLIVSRSIAHHALKKKKNRK